MKSRDYNSSLQDLLNKDKSLTIYQPNLHQLVTEIFNVAIETVPEIINDALPIMNILNQLCNGSKFRL